MTNAELIATLRGENYFVTLLHDAADALEAAEQRINELKSQAAFFDAEKQNYQENIEYRDERIKELEAQLPKEGEWIDGDARKVTARCSVCGHLRLGNGAKWANMYVPFCEICGARMDGETEHGNTYSLGKIEMPKGAIEQIIADGERKGGEHETDN